MSLRDSGGYVDLSTKYSPPCQNIGEDENKLDDHKLT